MSLHHHWADTGRVTGTLGDSRQDYVDLQVQSRPLATNRFFKGDDG